MQICPVCRGGVEKTDAAANNRMVCYVGRFYYLMCDSCKAEFMRNPRRYARGRRRETTPATTEKKRPAACASAVAQDHRAA